MLKGNLDLITFKESWTFESVGGFLYKKVCWQCLTMFWLYTSNQLSSHEGDEINSRLSSKIFFFYILLRKSLSELKFLPFWRFIMWQHLWKNKSFHQNSWNSGLETSWISLIHWPLRTSSEYRYAVCSLSKKTPPN